MLPSTKRWVEKMKEIGFDRSEFSCRTPQDGKGGWEFTEIMLNVGRIEKNLRDEEKTVEEYIEEKIDDLLDNGIAVIKSIFTTGEIHFSIYNIRRDGFRKASFQIYDTREDSWETVC